MVLPRASVLGRLLAPGKASFREDAGVRSEPAHSSLPCRHLPAPSRRQIIHGRALPHWAYLKKAVERFVSYKLLFVFLFSLTVATATSSLTYAEASPPPAPPPMKGESIFSPRFGVVAKVSMLGAGGDVGVSPTPLANVRVGANGMSITHSFQSHGIKY